MLTPATELLIEQSLLYPGGFLSPLAIGEAVSRALAEDLGRAGDITSMISHGSSPAFQNVCHWLRGLKTQVPGSAVTTSSPKRAPSRPVIT